MKSQILLLTGFEEAQFFKKLLLELNPCINVTVAFDLRKLAKEIELSDGDIRVVSFLTGMIVSPVLLGQLRITPYNIHPGPPEYPGSHPECFAIWEQALSYGVTAHEMTELVDDGPIVAVNRFIMPKRPELTEFSKLVYIRAIELFVTIATHCAKTASSMPRIYETWSPKKRTRKQLLALCRQSNQMDLDDQERLLRACGGDPPPMDWSILLLSKRRTDYGQQAPQT